MNDKNLELQGKKFLKEINKAREVVGLEELKVKIKNCLRCEKEFEALGLENFMCQYCRRFD